MSIHSVFPLFMAHLVWFGHRIVIFIASAYQITSSTANGLSIQMDPPSPENACATDIRSPVSGRKAYPHRPLHGPTRRRGRTGALGECGRPSRLRTGPVDAKCLADYFAPQFELADLMGLPVGRACASLLLNGAKAAPFTLEAPRPGGVRS